MNQFITHREAEDSLLILVTEIADNFTEGIVVVNKQYPDQVGLKQCIFFEDVVQVTLNNPDQFVVLADKLKSLRASVSEVRLEATRAFDQEMFHKLVERYGQGV